MLSLDFSFLFSFVFYIIIKFICAIKRNYVIESGFSVSCWIVVVIDEMKLRVSGCESLLIWISQKVMLLSEKYVKDLTVVECKPATYVVLA